MSAKLTPYINFNGQCKEAMSFYKSVLGGELLITTMAEGMPGSDDTENIMHASLENGDLSFMASDFMGDDFKSGNNIHMSIAGTDESALRGFFEGLSEGGKVEMPLETAPWGDTYGAFTDRYGLHWMINIHHEL